MKMRLVYKVDTYWTEIIRLIRNYVSHTLFLTSIDLDNLTRCLLRELV